MPVTPSPPRSERFLDNIAPLKSRRGCKTCKTRKIKCGEEKPSCRKCTLAKYKCEYTTSPPQAGYSYSSAPSHSSTVSILNAPSTSPNTVWRERRAFAYYFQHAAPYLAGGLDQEFWVTVVPRFCRIEPAVWDAVNAISTLFESPEMCLDFVFVSLRHERSVSLNPKQSDALGWYARSLSKVRTQIDRGSVDVQVALISCVLFVCIETLQGHVEEAFQLYNQGIQLILGLKAPGKGPIPALLENTIIPLFMRLGTAALTISGTLICDLFGMLDIPQQIGFMSFETARDALLPLAAEVQILQRQTGTNPFIGLNPEITPELIARRDCLQVRLSSWYSAYTAFVAKAPLSSGTRAISALMRAYHSALTIMLSTCLVRNSSVYDAYIPDFRTIVEQSGFALDASATADGTQPAFTFEQGVGPPLSWTALVCRDPSIRRQALALLRRAPPLQGFYKCTPGLTLASKIMELEEGISRALLHQKNESSGNEEGGEEIELTAKLIPEEARIQHYAVFRPRDQPHILGFHDIQKWKRGPEQLFLRFTRGKWDHDTQTWGLTDECVPMDCAGVRVIGTRYYFA
ncbi:hypothetical protein BDV18DRAFT_166107 [Aspergillus unguis]